MLTYDVIIIGFGKAGKTIAGDLANRQWKVAMIEKDPNMYGGTCIGYVGKITEVHNNLLLDNIDKGYICVIATIANGTDKNVVYNINADIAAAEIAQSLNAVKLILMTDVLGVMEDPKDPSTLYNQIDIADIPKLKEEGIITGGMIPKLDCCVSAIENGVLNAHIIDGTKKHSILIELLTDTGIGTMIY